MIFFMKKYFLIFFFCSISCVYSQKNQLIDTADYNQRTALISQYKSKHQFFNKLISKKYKGKLGVQIKKTYKEAQKSFLNIIEKKKLTFDKRFQDYTDSLSNSIIKSNPLLADEPIKILIAKDPEANALSIGDGTVILNLGLFAVVENEHQFASVLSHELAHQILQHTEATIVFRAEYEVSKEKREQTRAIRSQKFGRYEKAFDELKDLLYSFGKERKNNEIQADSLGYILFRNSQFKANEFVDALDHLASLDSIENGSLTVEDYKKFFDLPDYKFKEDWLKKEEFSAYNYENYKEKINLDSVKSHPEILQRIDRLKSQFNELRQDDNSTVTHHTNPYFTRLQEIAIQEKIPNLFYLEKNGVSIYTILKRIQENKIPENLGYYHFWLGKNFQHLYEAKKKYQMNRYVDTVVPNKQSENYQLFLTFIWNLKLEDLKAIGDYYLKIGKLADNQ